MKENAGLSRDELKDAVDSIASIQVYAEKPALEVLESPK